MLEVVIDTRNPKESMSKIEIDPKSAGRLFDAAGCRVIYNLFKEVWKDPKFREEFYEQRRQREMKNNEQADS